MSSILTLRGRISNAEYWTNSRTAFGHANTANVVGVGAVDYRFPSFPSSFTSRGGIPLFFDTNGNSVNTNRNQPRIAAQQNTDTTFFFVSPVTDPDSTGFPNFTGTSAAAPHAAAVAALMKDCDATLTPSQIYNAMEQSAIDIEFAPASTGFDQFTGYGALDAELALDYIADIEIGILGNGIPISDGSTTTSTGNNTGFGSVPVDGGAKDNDFLVRNETTNCGYISISGDVSISGTHDSDFSIVQQPNDMFLQYDETAQTFTVRFNPTATGTRTATVTVNSNDPDEGTYTFTVSGNGVIPDVNNDGIVSPVDVVEILNRIGDSSAVSTHDVNDDGVVNNIDAEITINSLGTTVP